MNNDVLAIVPVRSLTTGKTRLAPAVSPEVRSELTKRMLSVSLAAVRASTAIDQILVISPDVDVLAFAHSIDHEVINVRQDSNAPGLVPALNQARRVSSVNRFGAILVLFADLPLVNGSDVTEFATAEGQIIIAPDQNGVGTNGLVLRRGEVNLEAFAFQFGIDSFRSHVAESRRLGVEPTIVTSSGLAFDLDTPEDLSNLISIHPLATRDLLETGS